MSLFVPQRTRNPHISGKDLMVYCTSSMLGGRLDFLCPNLWSRKQKSIVLRKWEHYDLPIFPTIWNCLVGSYYRIAALRSGTVHGHFSNCWQVDKICVIHPYARHTHTRRFCQTICWEDSPHLWHASSDHCGSRQTLGYRILEVSCSATQSQDGLILVAPSSDWWPDGNIERNYRTNVASICIQGLLFLVRLAISAGFRLQLCKALFHQRHP